MCSEITDTFLGMFRKVPHVLNLCMYSTFSMSVLSGCIQCYFMEGEVVVMPVLRWWAPVWEGHLCGSGHLCGGAPVWEGHLCGGAPVW